MMPSASFFAPWYYHGPNLILLVLIWLLIVRLALSVLLGRGNLVVRVLEAATSPVLTAVGAITPRLVPGVLVVVFAIAWLLAARIALFVAVSATGVRLSMG